MSSGIRTKNKHLAEFQNIKSGFNKRKDDLNKKMRAPVVARGVTGGTKKTGAVSRAPIGMYINTMLYIYNAVSYIYVHITGTRVASMSAPTKKVVAVGTGVNAVRGRGVRGGQFHFLPSQLP